MDRTRPMKFRFTGPDSQLTAGTSFLIGSMDGFEWLQNVNLTNTKPDSGRWELNGRLSMRPFALITGGQKPSRLFKYLQKNPKG